MTTSFKIGDHVRINGNAKGTVWESGVIECIKDDRAYILYGVTKLGDWCGIRGMCTGESLSNLELITL
jgi:hypothetical protein